MAAGTLDNKSARRFYHEQLEAIASKIDRTKSVRDQAKQAFQLRNQARIDARALMSDRTSALMLDKTDPIRTWKSQIQYAVKEGYVGNGIWEYILESASKSRRSVDGALGLKR